MSRHAALLIAVLLTVSNALAAGPFFSVRGREVLGPDGKPFVMQGVNLGNWLMPEGHMFKFRTVNSPRLINDLISELVGPAAAAEFWKKYLDVYVTEADIHFLKATGANSLRVPFHYRLFTDESYLGSSDGTRGFMLLDRLIEWCRKENLPLILDMHAAPGGQTGDHIDDGYGYPFLFDSEADQQLAVDIWKRIAERYANEPIILGYDLLNEPIAPFFEDKERLNKKLEPVYRKIVAAIRSVDKNHIVLLGGAQWDQNFSVFGRPFDAKVIYTFHNYWSPTEQEVIQPWLNFRARHDVPIHCGETGENSTDWLRDFRKLLGRHHIGWHYWPYKKMDHPSCVVTFDAPKGYDQIVAYSQATRTTFEEVRKHRPKDTAAIQKTLDQFLENCQFKNCHPNAAYIEALGFQVPK
jgi:endoglucanase